MNRIEDEPVKFYLEHEAQIREWAALEFEVVKFADRFYRSLKGDIDAALRAGRIADEGVESFIHEVGDWPGLGFRRQDWPKGDDDPDVRLEWNCKSTRFSPGGHLVCGVRTNAERYRQPFAKERCPAYPRRSGWWPAYARVDPPVGRFWEGDNLKGYRERLVETLLSAWRDLAPLVDEAVSRSVDP